MQAKPTPSRLRRPTRPSKKVSKFTPSLVISLLAIVVSVTSMSLTWFVARDTAKATAIKEAYGAFFEMLKVQQANWQQGHLFALPDRYQIVKQQVAAATAGASPALRAELLLKERAVADYIFTIYEENLYLKRHAKDVGDTQRLRFLTEVEAYLTGKVLRNPRLLWYWSKAGGGLSESYEEETKAHYDATVLSNPAAPLAEQPDTAGPFQ